MSVFQGRKHGHKALKGMESYYMQSRTKILCLYSEWLGGLGQKKRHAREDHGGMGTYVRLLRKPNRIGFICQHFLLTL